MKAEDFDEKFDNNESIIDLLDLSSVKRGDSDDVRRVNVDFPNWMLDGLDKVAKHIGVTRQSIIKVWIAERLRQDELTNPRRNI